MRLIAREQICQFSRINNNNKKNGETGKKSDRTASQLKTTGQIVDSCPVLCVVRNVTTVIAVACAKTRNGLILLDVFMQSLGYIALSLILFQAWSLGVFESSRALTLELARVI